MPTTRKRAAAKAIEVQNDMFSYASDPRAETHDKVQVPDDTPSSTPEYRVESPPYNPDEPSYQPLSPTTPPEPPEPYTPQNPGYNQQQPPPPPPPEPAGYYAQQPTESYGRHDYGRAPPPQQDYGRAPPQQDYGRLPPSRQDYERRPPRQEYGSEYGGGYGGGRPSDNYRARRRRDNPSRIGELQNLLAQISRLVPERVWYEHNMHPPIAIGFEQGYFDRYHQRQHNRN